MWMGDKSSPLGFQMLSGRSTLLTHQLCCKIEFTSQQSYTLLHVAG